MSTTSESSVPTSDFVRDITLWKKKKQSLLVLSAATATWVLLEIYQFNSVTVISWAAIFIIVLLFLYGNFLRLLGKEPSALPGLEITEGSALVAANSSRVTVEEISRWMFRVGAEGDLFVFAGVIGGLWILSRIGNNFDLPTFLYIGTVLGMTVPAIYVRYEDKIKRYRERVKEQTRGYYEMINDKVAKMMKHKVAKMMKHKVPDKEEKEKKVE